ncbi:toxin VasX [Burkholderia cepacia]|uniref:toxin VasX n=1 Tax=Burkholderia cepacia TaxID=292 RepID=UPI001CF3BD3B|nr:toxin VasX [Burkholderia cepacia]MCA8351985.1 hypothetical protein [Burkholderia cepacia]
MSQPTYSLTDLLGISRDAANRTRSNEAPSPCVSCKRTLTILPLRYGVIADDDKAGVEQLASSLPAHLGKKLNVKLSDSRYAVRSVREGYTCSSFCRTTRPTAICWFRCWASSTRTWAEALRACVWRNWRR